MVRETLLARQKHSLDNRRQVAGQSYILDVQGVPAGGQCEVYEQLVLTSGST